MSDKCGGGGVIWPRAVFIALVLFVCLLTRLYEKTVKLLSSRSIMVLILPNPDRGARFSVPCSTCFFIIKQSFTQRSRATVTVIETLKSSLEVTQGHWKWYIRKLGCSFLLALHSNCGRIFSCFDTIHERDRHPTTTRQQERSRATNVSNQTVFWYSAGLFFTFSECLGLQVMLDGRMIDRLITCLWCRSKLCGFNQREYVARCRRCARQRPHVLHRRYNYNKDEACRPPTMSDSVFFRLLVT